MLMQLCEVVLPILREAGSIILGAHDVERENTVSVKDGSANFVTTYDVKVQEFLKREILKRIPNAAFIAEEQENDASVLNAEYCFVIDPIDATTNFIHDYRHSCISLALFSFGKAKFGAVYNPYLNEMFHAEADKGAYLNGKPIRVSERPMEIAIAAYGTAPYYKDTLLNATFAISREVFSACADLRRSGSAALDLAYVAAGRNDLFFELVLSPWDFAAGILLIKEAGGMVSDMSGKPLDLTQPCSVIAASKSLYPQLLDITKKHLLSVRKSPTITDGSHGTPVDKHSGS